MIPTPPSTGLVRAIDISNYQPSGQQLVDLIDQYGAEHIVVRIPQRVESATLHDIAKAQIVTILGAGKTLGGYGWLYKDVDPIQQASDWVDFIGSTGTKVPYMWLDIEPYQTNDNLPSTEQIKIAARTLTNRGERPGIYTGPWVWSLLRNPVDPELNTLPLWTAEYNGVPTLTDVTLYGGWTSVAGHQYSTSGGIDQDVFDQHYTVL